MVEKHIELQRYRAVTDLTTTTARSAGAGHRNVR
jgi:hypothetical protein